MATISEQIEIRIEGKSEQFAHTMRSVHAEFGAFVQSFQNSQRIFTNFSRGINFQGIARELGTSSREVRAQWNRAFGEISNSGNLASNTLKKNFFDVARAAGASSEQTKQVYNKFFGDLERRSVVSLTKVRDHISSIISASTGKKSAKDSFSVFEQGGLIPAAPVRQNNKAQLGLLDTLAHSMPFGIGRSAAFAGLNFAEMASGASAASGAISSIGAAILAIPVPILGAIVAGILAIKGAADVTKLAINNLFLPAIERGVEYNDLIQNVELGFAGLIVQMTDVYEGQRKLTDEWEGAIQISDKLVLQLQNAALLTRSTFVELARGMTEGFAPMLQRGLGEDQITPFVTRFIQGMNALRIPVREVGQEIRAFFNLETNPRTARMSFFLLGQAAKELGVSVEEAKKRLEAMTAVELYDWFMKSTVGMEKAGLESMKTLSGYWTNIQDFLDRYLGEGTYKLYLRLVSILEEVTKSFVTFDKQKNAVFNAEFVKTLDLVADVFEKVVNIVKDLILALPDVIKHLERVVNFFKTLKEIVDFLMGRTIIEFVFKNPPEWVKNFLSWASNNGKGKDFESWKEPFANEAAKQPSAFSEITQKQYGNLLEPIKRGYNPYSFKIPEPEKEQFGPTAEDYRQEMSRRYEEYFKEQERKTKESIKNAERAREEAFKAQQKFFDDWAKQSYDLEKTYLGEGEKRFGRIFSSYNEEREKEFEFRGEWANRGAQQQYQLQQDFLNQGNVIFGNIFQSYNQKTERQMERNADIFNKRIENYWRGPMSSVFTDLGKNGGRGFVQILANNFDRLIEDSAQKLVTLLEDLLGFGGNLETYKDEKGITHYTRNGVPITQAEYQQLNRRQAGMSAAMTGVNIAVGSYASGRAGTPGSMTAGFIGGGMTGASTGAYLGSVIPGIGNVVGAVVGALVGAIVGYISAAMGKAAAREEYKFAVPGMDKYGTWTLGGTRNIEDLEKEELEARINEQMSVFWNGYMKLAVKYTTAVLPTLEQFSGWHTIQPEASKNMLKHLEEWISGKLPDLISAMFGPALEAAAVRLGMTAAKFREIFKKFDTLDPKKALELTGILFETLSNFDKLRLFFANYGYENDFGSKSRMSALIEQADIEQRQGGYAQQFRNTANELEKLAASIDDLTGEAQIRAAHELSSTLVEMMERQKEIAREMAAFLIQSRRTFGQLRQELELAGMGTITTDAEGNKVFSPDYQAQSDYLEQYLQEIMNNLAVAGNLSELEYWQNEFFRVFNQLGGIAQQMGPDAYESFRQWALGMGGADTGILGQFQTAIANRVAQLGEAIDNVFDDMMSRLNPVIENFKTKLNETGETVGDTGEDFDGLDGPMGRFKYSLEATIPVLERIASIRVQNQETDNDLLVSDDTNQLSSDGFEQRTIARRYIRRRGIA